MSLGSHSIVVGDDDDDGSECEYCDYCDDYFGDVDCFDDQNCKFEEKTSAT